MKESACERDRCISYMQPFFFFFFAKNSVIPYKGKQRAPDPVVATVILREEL